MDFGAAYMAVSYVTLGIFLIWVFWPESVRQSISNAVKETSIKEWVFYASCCLIFFIVMANLTTVSHK